MNNAFAEPQNIVLLGGTSDIGLAIVEHLLGPATRRIVLACRDVDAGERYAVGLRQRNVDVRVMRFDGAATDAHEAFSHTVAEAIGDIDVVIVAFALLGDDDTLTDAAAAALVAHVNFTGVVASTVAFANRLREQGHGSIVMLSSVAGERVRKANPVYGGTKAGIDGFAQGFGDALEGDGVRMLVVRPGFVHTSMTAGRPAAPFATTADAVAAVTVAGLRSGRRTVWAPGILRPVFSILRHLPGVVWRRLPLG